MIPSCAQRKTENEGREIFCRSLSLDSWRNEIEMERDVPRAFAITREELTIHADRSFECCPSGLKPNPLPPPQKNCCGREGEIMTKIPRRRWKKRRDIAEAIQRTLVPLDTISHYARWLLYRVSWNIYESRGFAKLRPALGSLVPFTTGGRAPNGRLRMIKHGYKHV